MAQVGNNCLVCFLLNGCFVDHSPCTIMKGKCFRCAGSNCWDKKRHRSICSLNRDAPLDSGCFACYFPLGVEDVSIHSDNTFGTPNCTNKYIKEALMFFWKLKPRTFKSIVSKYYEGELDDPQKVFDVLFKHKYLDLPIGLFVFVDVKKRNVTLDLEN